jgi:hypothetical protein
MEPAVQITTFWKGGAKSIPTFGKGGAKSIPTFGKGGAKPWVKIPALTRTQVSAINPGINSDTSLGYKSRHELGHKSRL